MEFAEVSTVGDAGLLDFVVSPGGFEGEVLGNIAPDNNPLCLGGIGCDSD